MSLGKFLYIVIGGIIIYLLLKKYFRNLQGPPPAAKPPIAENMVRCAHCGVNVPQTEAIFSRGEYFCGDEHLQRKRQ